MSESEFGKMLLNQDTGTLPGDLTARVLQRDRRIVGILTGAAIGLWLLCVLGIVLFYVGFLFFILPKVNQLLTQPETTQNATHDWRTLLGALVSIGHPIIVMALIALMLAALTTVALIYLSRRATLRQMNAALAELSEQLRQLRTSGQQ